MTSGLLVVALLLVPVAGRPQEPIWEEQVTEADRLRAREAFPQAEALYQAALAIAEKSGDNVRMARALNGLAGTLQDQGRYRDGLAASRRSLQMLAGLRTAEDPATLAPAYYNIGGCLWHLGSYRESEKAFLQALAAIEESRIPNDQEAATILGALGIAYVDMGRLGEAETVLQRALRMRTANPQTPKLSIAQAWKSLGELHYQQGNLGQAEHCLRRAANLSDMEIAQSPVVAASIFNALAMVYYSRDDVTGAEASFERARAILETGGNANPVLLATIQTNLGEVNRVQRHFPEAEAWLTRALVTWKGGTHPGAARTLEYLARVYADQKLNRKAEPLYQRALDMTARTLPPGHFQTGMLLGDLAELHRFLGEYGESEALYSRAIPVLENSLGAEHPALAATLSGHAKVLRKLKRKREAAQVEARAQRIREHQAFHPGALTVDVRELGKQ